MCEVQDQNSGSAQGSVYSISCRFRFDTSREKLETCGGLLISLFRMITKISAKINERLIINT